MSRVIDSWWYTTSGGHCIGIVKTVDDTTKEIKFRIGLADGLNHIFEYKYDYAQFLDTITYVIKKGKERKNNNDNVYKSKHKVIIQ